MLDGSLVSAAAKYAQQAGEAGGKVAPLSPQNF